MFIIPCKYVQNSCIFECVSSIKKYFPNHKICVVDSKSTTLEYCKYFGNDILFLNQQNENFCDGALWKAYEIFQKEKFFYLIHDSMIIKKNFDFVEQYDFHCISTFPNNSWSSNFNGGISAQKEYVKNSLENTKFKYLDQNDDWCSIFGISFFVSRVLLDELKKMGLNKCLPKNKMQMEASERLWGMCLSQIGIDPSANSLMDVPFHMEKNQYIEKKFLRRI